MLSRKSERGTEPRGEIEKIDKPGGWKASLWYSEAGSFSSNAEVKSGTGVGQRAGVVRRDGTRRRLPRAGSANEKTRNEEKLEEKKGGQGLGFFLRFKPCIRNI